ncbi:MAG TPA: alpha/beta hydrolase [Rubrivivax sp.]|nr:alpha/beta hydrolase [Rubrivivax sp.]
MRTVAWSMLALLAGLGAAAAVAAPGATGDGGTPRASATRATPRQLAPCWPEGVERAALCGSVRRALDPARPDGVAIDVHFAVLPALARQKEADPVFFFAGGPGQSAIALAGTWARMYARLANRRDLVFVDQRGTGASAPLQCAELPPTAALALTAGRAQRLARLAACRAALQRLAWGDLRQYTTTVAMGDIDAVRVALGAGRIDLVGGSYGTRAALEYLRQFPRAVRRTVLDGVAPPDMALPASLSTDSQAALDGLLAACAAEARCRERYPALHETLERLLASLPREADVAQPFTGRVERLVVEREFVLGLLRAPLYAPWVAAALPEAITEAAAGRLDALAGLASVLAGGGARSSRLAEGMHFSVLCAEDVPRLALGNNPPGADFGQGDADFYRAACAQWPRGAVPAAFYVVPAAPSATLVLSGGADPATPPRHGARVARALGARARHVVVPAAGHGTLMLPCVREAAMRFIDAADDAAALAVDADCARALPRPGVFVPVGGAVAGVPGRAPTPAPGAAARTPQGGRR